MRRKITQLGLFAALFALPAMAQLGMFSNDQSHRPDREWKGERFPDGRPKVPDEVLDRWRTVSAEEAWGTMRAAGYTLQFEGGWKTVRSSPVSARLVGRVVTAAFMPLRPDINNFVNENAKKEDRVGRGQNSWVIDTLVKRDVMVVDLFGKIKDGTIIGDNLGTSIMTKTGTGLVVDGAVRDVTGISEIKGFQVYARDFHPSAPRRMSTLMRHQRSHPHRHTSPCLPGDVVLSDPEGLTFIPAHLAEKVADEAELTRLRDDWGHEMLREQKYTPGQIDTPWTRNR